MDFSHENNNIFRKIFSLFQRGSFNVTFFLTFSMSLIQTVFYTVSSTIIIMLSRLLIICQNYFAFKAVDKIDKKIKNTVWITLVKMSLFRKEGENYYQFLLKKFIPINIVLPVSIQM